MALVIGFPSVGWPQQPFDLDPAFRTSIEQIHISSILPLEGGDVLLSGQFRFEGDGFGLYRYLGRVDPLGARVTWFPYAFGGDRITSWNEQIYVKGSATVRRMNLDGSTDGSFINMNSSPYFSSFQGGDYHVFDDGRVLLSGRHNINDPERGFVGPYCLCWFSNEGYLDTTRVHRPCSTTLDVIAPLPNGQFMGSGYTATYDGQPSSNILRFNADGSLDPGFQANVVWRRAHALVPLDDGRVYAAGQFMIEGDPDTLHLVRFMSDGSLDESFNNHLDFRIVNMTTFPNGALLRALHLLDDGRVVVMGNFEQVDGEQRGCVCMVDSLGNLSEQYFAGAGCGNFTYQGGISAAAAGLFPAPDGAYYICGAYHGYDDGTTNDTAQRMVSRLHGLEVGVPERAKPVVQLSLHPNPASTWVAFDYELVARPEQAALVLKDLVGREVQRFVLAQPKGEVLWDTRALAPGTYTATMMLGAHPVLTEKLIIRQ